MEKNWLLLVLFVLAFIAILFFLFKKNHKVRKELFKKSPGDYPDPKKVKSEFDFDFNAY